MTTEDLLFNYSPAVSELGRHVRALLLVQLPGILEYPDAPAKLIGFGYGPGYKESIAVILPSKKMIKLGFYKGASLPDPSQLLKGSGKVNRYAELHNAEDLTNPSLLALIGEAQKAYLLRKVGKL